MSVSSKNKRQKISKIKYIFISLCAFITAATIILISNFSIQYTKKVTQDQYENDCTTISQAYSHVVSSFLTQAKTALTLFSLDDNIINGSTQTIVSWLKNHHNLKQEYFLNVFFIDRAGNLYTSAGSTTNVKDREYFLPAINGTPGDFIVGNGMISRTTKKMSVHVLTPIFDKEGNNKGIVGAAIGLKYLHKIFNNAQIGTKGRIFILDKNGLFLSHPDENYFMKDFVPPVEKYKEETSFKLSRIRDGIVQSVSTIGEEVYIFLKPVEDTDWTVGVSVPKTEIFKLYTKLRTIQAFIFIVVIFEIIFFVALTTLFIHFVNTSYDPITNLYTQNRFEKKATKLLKKYEGSRFILIDADLRGFKFVNQTYGEKAANNVLIKFANIIKDKISHSNGICAKGYADHFYIFSKIETASTALEYFSKAIEEINNELKTGDVPVSAKYGITFLNSNQRTQNRRKTIKNLIGEASFAKSLIKENITKSFEIYSPRIEEKLLFEQRIESQMEKAVQKDEFFVMYQPKIQLSTDKIVGAEALVRWNSSDPELGFLSPIKFIPLFEKNGFIEELDFIVYEKVFKFLRQQIDTGNSVVPISVNMSRNHTKPEKINNFISRFLKIFNRYKLSPDLIEVEILEQSVADEELILNKVIDALHTKGFSVAMDDFGSGESSLNMLSTIPIDVVKFDQNFLRNNSSLEESSDFITSLVDLGKKLNKKTVFEGVETKEQRDFLKSINCDLVQGYFYSKPLSESDFIQFVKEHI